MGGNMVDASSFIGWDDNRDYLLPAYSEQQGQWLKRRMTSGEASLWLIECLAHQGMEVFDDHPRLPSTAVTLTSRRFRH